MTGGPETHFSSLRSSFQTIRVAATVPTDSDVQDGLEAGEMYYDSTLNKIGIYDGSTWRYSSTCTSTTTSA